MNNFSNEAGKLALQYNESVIEKMRQICSPIFENFGINDFNYTKFFSDGNSVLHLSSNMEWRKHLFLEVSKNGPLFQKAVTSTPQKEFYYFLWPLSKCKEDHILSAYQEYNMWHGVTLYRREGSILEAFDFATKKENEQINNFFINKKEKLERFVFYFKEKACNIINMCDKEYLHFFPERHKLENIENSFSRKKFDEFVKQTQIKKYTIIGKEGPTYLSKREAECLNHIADGKTAKETSRLVGISHRTVEYYINNIKIKTGCQKQTEVIRFYTESKIRLCS